MRSIWKGAIAFGLVNVPVKMYSATESHNAPLHQVHAEDGGRIRYLRRCEKCDQIVEYADITKAYIDGEQTVVLSDEELKSLPEERSREIEVVEFVPTDQVDQLMFDSSYYLEPDSASIKPYVLLRETLEKTDRLAIVKYALRQKTRLAALRVRGDVLVIQTLLWPDEIREPEFEKLDEDVKISKAELAMATQLVDSLSEDFEPSEYTDDYQAHLKQLIEAKIEKGEAFDTSETFGAAEEADESGDVIDLMEALRQSVAKKRGKSGPEAESEETESKPAKKTARKAPAKKTAAKKTTAKKAPAKKAAAS